jgi:hypothetical protein
MPLQCRKMLTVFGICKEINELYWNIYFQKLYTYFCEVYGIQSTRNHGMLITLSIVG